MHVLDHLTHSERNINPVFYSTWMDEDFLKKVSKTIRLTSVKSAQVRVLQRWLLAAPANLSKSKANSGYVSLQSAPLAEVAKQNLSGCVANFSYHVSSTGTMASVRFC